MERQDFQQNDSKLYAYLTRSNKSLNFEAELRPNFFESAVIVLMSWVGLESSKLQFGLSKVTRLFVSGTPGLRAV